MRWELALFREGSDQASAEGLMVHIHCSRETRRPAPIPEEMRGGWNVEAEFVGAIRGENVVTHTDFLTGVRYMQFTEAVARSSRHQQPVELPLKEFSNPSL